MITVQRSAKVRAGKGEEAVQFAKEVTEYLKGKPSHVLDMRVYEEVFGNFENILWLADYESLAAYEDLSVQLPSDEDWLAFVAMAGDLFIEGSWHDTVMQTL